MWTPWNLEICLFYQFSWSVPVRFLDFLIFHAFWPHRKWRKTDIFDILRLDLDLPYNMWTPWNLEICLFYQFSWSVPVRFLDFLIFHAFWPHRKWRKTDIFDILRLDLDLPYNMWTPWNLEICLFYQFSWSVPVRFLDFLIFHAFWPHRKWRKTDIFDIFQSRPMGPGPITLRFFLGNG